MNNSKKIVNSWNEWDALKHVIVGRADGTCIPAPEPALDAKVPEDSDMRGQFGPRTKDAVEKANQLLNDFSNILEKRGIKVDRPTPIDFNQKTSTPDWDAETMFGCMPPRDVLLTVGNEILEATMSYRCRWFEYLCYRPLLKEYFNQDPNNSQYDPKYMGSYFALFQLFGHPHQITGNNDKWLISENLIYPIYRNEGNIIPISVIDIQKNLFFEKYYYSS